MSAKQKSFVFNLEWFEVLKEHPAEVRLEVYEAIMRYASSGTLPDLKPLAAMAFSFIKKEMDYNRQKYEDVCEKRRESGRKGGERTQAKQAIGKQNKQMPPIATNCKQPQAKQADNEYDNEYELSSTTSKSTVVDAVQHQEIVDEFLSNKIDVEAFCINNHISVDDLKKMAGEILVEWKLTDQSHDTRAGAKRHLINQIRIKLSKKRNETKPQDRYAKRRGTDSAAYSAEDYPESI